MSRLATAIILLLVSLHAVAQAPCPAATNTGAIASANWSYDIALADAQRQVLRVRMSVAPTSPRLEVQLPVWNAVYQVRDFAEHVNWLRATDAEGKPVVVRKLDKTTWSAPNATTVEYEVAAIDTGPFGTEFTTHHAFLNLAQMLVYPVGVPRQGIRIRMSGVPAEWRVATPLNSTGDGFCAANYDELVDSPVEIGNFHEVDFELDGAQYRVIIDADPDDFDPTAIANLLKKIVATEVDWMQDRPFHRYTFFYHFPKEYGRGGMEHAYSTAIEASAGRVRQDPQSIAGVSSHEFFHLWNVKRIRPQSLEPIDYTKENYTRALWFSEGVTNTVSMIVLFRAGLTGEREFLDAMARDIKTLEIRPANTTQSAEESSLDAWLEKYPFYRAPERSVSYYDKGQILGLILDLEMRRVTNGRKSLRDLFLWMNEHYAKAGKFFDDSNGVRAAVETVTGTSFQNFFQRYVAHPEPIPYDDFLQTVGLKLERTPSTKADPGFTAAANFGPTPVVIGVSSGSEAEKAGLKPGDSILMVNDAEPGNDVVARIAEMEIGATVKLKVGSRRATREVKYRLGSKQDTDFTIKDLPNVTAAQRARRTAWMHGDDEAMH